MRELTGVCLDALEFVFIDVGEERSGGFVSGVVAALSHIPSPSLNKKQQKSAQNF